MTTDPDAPPTDEELAESQRLREALEDASKDHEGAELLRSVRHAVSPRSLEGKALGAAVERGVSAMGRGMVVRLVFGAGAALAVAAAFALYLGRPVSFLGAPPELLRARSTQALFSTRFAREGGESARIDRIAIARTADLRDNEFARWGVGR